MEDFETHLRAVLAHVDAAADNAAQDYDLRLSTDEKLFVGHISDRCADFYIEDASDLLQSQTLFLEALAARYRRAFARAVNSRLFTEGA
jgi:hypothetical protein